MKTVCADLRKAKVWISRIRKKKKKKAGSMRCPHDWGIYVDARPIQYAAEGVEEKERTAEEAVGDCPTRQWHDTQQTYVH